MNLDEHYRLADGVAIRRERFGGLAYHYHTRQLYFLHSHALTEFVTGLSGRDRLADALEAFRDRAGAPALSTEGVLRSLSSLEKIGLVVRVTE